MTDGGRLKAIRDIVSQQPDGMIANLLRQAGHLPSENETETAEGNNESGQTDE